MNKLTFFLGQINFPLLLRSGQILALRNSPERFICHVEAEFGAAIAEMRHRQNLRQYQVAKAAYLDASYIASLERGDRCPPPFRTVKRLAHALSLSECESRQLQKLAAVERITRAISSNSLGLGTEIGLERLIRLASALHPETLDAVFALIETLSRRDPAPHKEGGM